MNEKQPAGSTPSPDKLAFNLRILDGFEEYHRAEELQREIWGITDDTEIVPKDILLIAQKNGGLAAGAFDHAGRMIGILFGFLGMTSDGRWKHCSHLMGVLHPFRTSGVGEALKNFQRDYVLQQGLDLVTWTVNPLEGVNASLNFGKLGVVCRSYHPNFYGTMADGLNQGLPSDRFEVEWWVNSPRVASRLAHSNPRMQLSDFVSAGARPVNLTWIESGFRISESPRLNLDAGILLFEVPANFQNIKSASASMALGWVDQARAVFEAYLHRGYLVSEFVSETGSGERRNYYVLQRGLDTILSR